jgi:hypothetical protein
MDSYLERLHEAITSATKGMTVEELHRHAPGKWSTAEVLEHLYLSYTGTVKGLGRCLEEGKPLARPQTLKDRMAATLVTEVGYFPSGRKSPKQAQPRGIAAEQVVAEIGPEIRRMDALLAQCAERLGNALILDHPIIGPLTAKQWAKFHWVHGRHHVKQIRRMRSST